MSKSSEPVILLVSNVKNKKCDGCLYLFSEHLKWMPSGKDTFTISYHYSDIKVQKISPETKEKVQLQVVLQSSGANTFHFNNPGGKDAQLKDRESVKEVLQQMLTKFKRKVNSDIEEKNRMFLENPTLFCLYKSLVVGGVMTTEEFWANQKSKEKDFSKQEIGVSAGFLADIEGRSDSSNGIRYNLTVDIIDNIFKTYPAVERKHAEYVPDRLTEQEFWYEFFQSHYFHRDRTNVTDKELFADCIQKDEQAVRKEIEIMAKDKSFDIHPISEAASGENCATGSQNTKLDISQNSNSFLCRRFNQHSTLVLKTDQSLSIKPKSQPVDAAGAHNSDTTNETSIVNNKKRAMNYSNEPEESTSGPVLKLSKIEAYKQGPTPETVMTYNTRDELFEAARAFTHEVMAWKPTPPNQLLTEQAALDVLWKLSPTGSLMQDATSQQFNDNLPKEIQQELKSLYIALSELLRHFWSCFPVSTKELEDKLLRMEDCLRKFQKSKIHPFNEKLASYRLTVDPSSHTNIMIEKAFTKFSQWQSKKSMKRS